MQRRLFFIGLLTLVVLRAVLFLPAALDFRNFAFRDLGSFQHLDQLIGQGLRPGIDFGFYYGFLGILVQHVYFAVFGAGHWPTIGLLVIYLLLMVVFWYFLSRDLGQSPATFAVIAGLSGMMIYVGPWPPTPAHVLLELSMAFSLYFVLKRRLSLALSIAVMGALAIPSLPIVLAGLIAMVIAWEWWRTPGRTARGLLAQYAPAATLYAGAILLLAMLFGWRPVIGSLLPTRGAAVYRALNFGFFGPSGRNIWYPPFPHAGHYLYTKAGIWILCSVLLVIFGCMAAVRIVRTGKLLTIPLFIVLCCAIHLIFVFAAFGNEESTVYYSVVLCAGVVAGLSDLTNTRVRGALSGALLVLGLLSQHSEVKAGLTTWKNANTSPDTASLYSPNDFQPEWKSVLSLAKNRRVFLLSYGTGVGLYCPRIGIAESWLLLPGLPEPRESSYLLQQVQKADAVVEELRGPTLYVDGNKELQSALSRFPLKESGNYFRIWSKDPLTPVSEGY